MIVNPALCTRRYFMPRPKAGLQVKECGTSKINPASDLLGVLVVCDEHRAEVLEFAIIKQDGLVLFTRD